MSETADEQQLQELLERWEDQRQRGQPVRPEQLCAHRPDLLDQLKRRIKALESMQWLLNDDSFNLDAPQNELEERATPKTLGRYRLDDLIGTGGFGQVWRGFDPELQRSVAIKVPRPDRLSPQSADRFLDEARKVAQLHHLGIVPVHDAGRQGDWCYIVSEFIEGESLAQRIANLRLKPAEAMETVAKVADALQFAHEQGFVHRDIKPANILLDRQGRVYLTDFGIAISNNDQGDGSPTYAGTLAYMSPEQRNGNKSDARTDIYSLGVVLCELLNGKKPALNGSQFDPRFMNSSGLAKEVLDVCAKCIAHDPEHRYASAADLAQALRSSVKPIPNHTLSWTIFAFVILISLGGVGWWFSKKDRSSQGRETRPTAIQSEKQEPAHQQTEIKSAVPSMSVAAHQVPITTAAISHDGLRIASGGEDKIVKLWNVSSAAITSVGTLEQSIVPTAAAFSPDGNTLAVGGKNGLLRLWDLTTSPPKERTTQAGSSEQVVSLLFSDDGKFLVAGGRGGTTRIWRFEGSEMTYAALPQVTGKILSLSFQSDTLLVGVENGELWAWRLGGPGQVEPISRGMLDGVPSISAMCISEDQRVIVAGSNSGMVGVWRLPAKFPPQAGDEARTLAALTTGDKKINQIIALPGVHIGILPVGSSHIGLWNRDTANETIRLEKLGFVVTCFVIGRDGDSTVVVAGTADGSLNFWRLDQKRLD